MNETTGWTIFSVAIVVAMALTIMIVVPVITNNETERVVACIEAGLRFIAGTCT